MPHFYCILLYHPPKKKQQRAGRSPAANADEFRLPKEIKNKALFSVDSRSWRGRLFMIRQRNIFAKTPSQLPETKASQFR